MSQILLKVRLIGNRTSCRPVWSAITYTNLTRDYWNKSDSLYLIVPLCFNKKLTRMITDRRKLHSDLLLLQTLVPIRMFHFILMYLDLAFAFFPGIVS